MSTPTHYFIHDNQMVRDPFIGGDGEAGRFVQQIGEDGFYKRDGHGAYIREFVKFRKVENVPFQARMKIIKFSSGRSRSDLVLQHADGTTFNYPMSRVSDLLDAVIICNAVHATWIVRKHGSYFSLQIKKE